MKQLNLIILSLMLIMSSVSISQCNFYIDTTITPSTTNINALNSVQIIQAGVCIDSIYSDSGSVHWDVIATSDEMIFDWSDIPQPGCTSGTFTVTVYDSMCNVVPHDTIVFQMPFSGWNGTISKHFTTNIGEKYTIEIVFDKDGDKCEAFQICVWAYAIGTDFLNMYTRKVTLVNLEDPFPNPCNEVIRFELPERYLMLEVVNIQGQRMFVKEKQQGQTILDVGTLDLPTGVYLFRFTDQAGRKTVKKVIVIH